MRAEGLRTNRPRGILGAAVMGLALVLARAPSAPALPTLAPPSCVGDCDGNGAVAVTELIKGVNISLESAPLDTCPQFDASGDGAVTVNELVVAVNYALTACPLEAPTATPTEGPAATETPTAVLPTQSPKPTATPTLLPTGTAAPTATALPPTPPVPTSPPDTRTPAPTASSTPLAAATFTRTATLPPTPAVTSTATPTAKHTVPADSGPLVTFVGAADTAGCLACPLGTTPEIQPGCVCTLPLPTPVYENGIRVFPAPRSGVVMLVVEGRPQSSSHPPVGTALTDQLPGGTPDLQVVASRPLGNGNTAVVCPDATGAGSDGIPAAAFANPDAAALRDFACRFLRFDVNEPCTLNFNGLSGLGNGSGSPTVQFCGYYMGFGQTVPGGDTTFTVRLRDTAGHLGPPAQIIVRRLP